MEPFCKPGDILKWIGAGYPKQTVIIKVVRSRFYRQDEMYPHSRPNCCEIIANYLEGNTTGINYKTGDKNYIFNGYPEEWEILDG